MGDGRDGRRSRFRCAAGRDSRSRNRLPVVGAGCAASFDFGRAAPLCVQALEFAAIRLPTATRAVIYAVSGVALTIRASNGDRRHHRSREIPHHRADRRGGDGRGVSRPRPGPESPRRDQGDVATRSPATTSCAAGFCARRRRRDRSSIRTSSRSTTSARSTGISTSPWSSSSAKTSRRCSARHAPLTLVQKIDILVDVLGGLGYAHKRGIVHRDIKPANIRVDEEGRARIMDFGIARLQSSKMTRTGLMVGTPAYMAPEQITSGADLGGDGPLLRGRRDVRAAHGQQAVRGREPAERVLQDRELVAAGHHHVSSSLPASLNTIVMRALAKEPAERYASATDMANALTEARASSRPRLDAAKGSVAPLGHRERTARRGRTQEVAGVQVEARRSRSAGAAAAVVAMSAWSTRSALRSSGSRADDDAGRPAARRVAHRRRAASSDADAVAPPAPAPARQPRRSAVAKPQTKTPAEVGSSGPTRRGADRCSNRCRRRRPTSGVARAKPERPRTNCAPATITARRLSPRRDRARSARPPTHLNSGQRRVVGCRARCTSGCGSGRRGGEDANRRRATAEGGAAAGSGDAGRRRSGGRTPNRLPRRHSLRRRSSPIRRSRSSRSSRHTRARSSRATSPK